ncbi:MAG: DMT family transporter [Acetobacter okinawensis]|uniref:DMT family transporter n=1 Tax=Acetobacter okinawensis TaxID=1076594 RepID=UPI001FD3AE4F|nr:DMT family transporter [Acetobacter okinawensis]
MPDQSLPAREKIAFRTFSREEWALVSITVLWGVTFLVVHTAMRYTGAMFFVGLRFTTAALLSMLLFRRLLLDLTLREVRAGACVGVAIFFGYALQTVGLGSISSSQSAFITAMYVPVVPFLQWFFFRKPPHLMVWLGVLFAFCGLVLLTGPQAITHLRLQFGEVITLVSTIAIAMEVVLISRFASPAINSFRVAIVQLFVAGLLAFAAMPVMGEHVPAFAWWWAVPALGLGVMSAVIQLVMNWAQKTVSPTRATLIYAGEPVWAGLVGHLAGDALPLRAVLGGGMVILGVLTSEVRLPRKRVRE